MRGSKVGIIGAGRSGIAAARLLKKLGAVVLISDSGKSKMPIPAGIAYEFGGHSRRLLSCQLIIRSPGVPSHLPIIKEIIRRGIPVWSELELASRYAKAKQLIAITGTNGKTTTTSLEGAILRACFKPTFVAGNIGTPFSEIVSKTTARAIVVLEVSSYQLEDIDAFHPTISAILNITPDHLEHHGSMSAYAAAKARIFENQTPRDVCVLNVDDLWCRRLAKKSRAQVLFFSRLKKLKSGVWMDGKDLVVRWQKHRARWTLESHLPGPHNVENILASVAMAVAAGAPISVIRGVLRRFKGVEHRLETTRTLRGVTYVNDSKGTNVDSTRVALASFESPLLLIMGGQGKGSPYLPLRPLIKRRVKKILLIGEDSPRIEKELRGVVPIEQLHTMRKAVARAAMLAIPGDTVLLSPACASFDQYRNYEERGQDFKKLVRRLR